MIEISITKAVTCQKRISIAISIVALFAVKIQLDSLVYEAIAEIILKSVFKHRIILQVEK